MTHGSRGVTPWLLSPVAAGTMCVWAEPHDKEHFSTNMRQRDRQRERAEAKSHPVIYSLRHLLTV